MDAGKLRSALAARVDGEIRFDQGSRAVYAHDGSNYRQVPVGVVVPRETDAAVAAIAVCHEFGAPVLSRGGGTSLAGQCCNEAVVIDWTKYCHHLVSVDPRAKTAVVEPGAVLDQVNRALASYGLMVGPKPSTHVSCTIGGMIGNNSCGSTAQAYGKMADSVQRLEIVTYDGVRTWVGPTSDEEYAGIVASGGRRAEIYRQLHEIRDRYLGQIRTGFPNIPRRVSGYNLDQLLPENDFHVARALVGSESTLVTVLHAELGLVEVPKARALVVLGYPDIADAADTVPLVTRHHPLAVEGLDDRLISLEREEHLASSALEKLPEGSGWLMVQFGGDDANEAEQRAHRLIDELESDGSYPRPHVSYLDDPAVEDNLWAVREAGLGATAYPPGAHETHEGWEDAAVPPERLGDYLRDFRLLLERHDYQGASLYGHFGHGCVHTRIPFELRTADGIAAYRAFVADAADLVVAYGGSLSGEHGDGQSRGELLPKMFGPELMRAFGEVKAIFDPGNKMNPGKVVEPYRLDQFLTLSGWQPREPETFFHYPAEDGKFTGAASRCVGVGKCRRDSGGVMCPSYRVTHEEEHATRGRARLLMEMVRGEVITNGWRSREVRDALDLCLSCKGCRKDCPVDVDMATYKAEFLAHHYAGRLRPASHYTMGWLPVMARIAAIAPKVVNAITHAPGLSWLLKLAGGVDTRRELPRFAGERFTHWYARRGPRRAGERVLLWPDTFTNNFHPEVAKAAVTVLEDAGFAVDVPAQHVCCGLTWISTGQLRTAKRQLERTIGVLRPALEAGWRVVVLEPSCAAVFRSDAPELLATPDAKLLAERTSTLAEVLMEKGWQPEAAEGRQRAIAQVHCHQHAIMGFGPDQQLLAACGVETEVLDSGCCGLAGNFGFERGHYEVSVGCAERGLWPAVSNAAPDTAILADGFSCRTQIQAGKLGREGIHLAQLLASFVPEPEPAEPEPAEPEASGPGTTELIMDQPGAVPPPAAVPPEAALPASGVAGVAGPEPGLPEPVDEGIGGLGVGRPEPVDEGIGDPRLGPEPAGERVSGPAAGWPEPVDEGIGERPAGGPVPVDEPVYEPADDFDEPVEEIDEFDEPVYELEPEDDGIGGLGIGRPYRDEPED
jgi:FAD/FMN-containing dehydrogenase/Fe-S oxidoreductase